MKILLITIGTFLITYFAFAYLQGKFNFLEWQKEMRAAHLYATLVFSILGSVIHSQMDI